MKVLQITALAASLGLVAVSSPAQDAQDAPLTLEEAVAIALGKQPGQVVEAEPDQFEGRSVVDIEILDAAGREVEFVVDTQTGEILKQWVDDDPSDDPITTRVLTTQVSAAPYVERSIPLDWALTAALAAQQACSDLGFATTVTVVDQRALPRVQLMQEGAFPHTIHTSSRKAMTAASRREATSVIEAENEHEPTLGAVFNEIGLITLSGGIPIVFDGEVIGGIGIAGSPGEDATGKEYDDICAEAGISAISDHLK